MCVSNNNKIGYNPANVQWTVVRGDSATLRVDFLDSDEVTHFDTEGWTYRATAYDPSGDFLDSLSVSSPENGYVLITAGPTVTRNWGVGYKTIVAELPFDLQARFTVNGTPVTWTPVVGTIRVLGDVSTGGSL